MTDDTTKTEIKDAAKEAASGIAGWIDAHPKAAWTFLCVVVVLAIGIWIGVRVASK